MSTSPTDMYNWILDNNELSILSSKGVSSSHASSMEPNPSDVRRVTGLDGRNQALLRLASIMRRKAPLFLETKNTPTSSRGSRVKRSNPLLLRSITK